MTVLSIKNEESEFPIIKLDDRPDASGSEQVVIRFIHQLGVHWTLHKKDKGILLTASSPDSWSTWSQLRIGVAKKLGIKDPEKHGHYSHHNLLPIVSNLDGYHLGSRRVYPGSGKGDAKYLKNAESIGSSSAKSVMIKMILSTEENPYEGDGFSTLTSLGYLYFLIEK